MQIVERIRQVRKESFGLRNIVRSSDTRFVVQKLQIYSLDCTRIQSYCISRKFKEYVPIQY